MSDALTRAILNRLNGKESSGRFSVFLADDAGLISIVSSYSGQSHAYRAGPAAGDVWKLHRLHGLVLDSGAFDSALYGTNIDLTTGAIEIGIASATTSSGASITTDLLGGQTVTDNSDWARYTSKISNIQLGDAEFMTVDLEFDPPVHLSGTDLDKVLFIVQSDFTGLVDHTWLAQGLQFTE